MTNQRISVDAPSSLSQFGWEKIGTNEQGVEIAIPVILRHDNVRYTPCRIVEQEIIKKYSTLPQTVFQCITIKSFYVTPAEAKLLNNINFNHCNANYGEEFFSTKDLIISVQDVKGLSRFLNITYNVYSNNIAQSSNKVGIIRLNLFPNDVNQILLVPYLCKSMHGKTAKFVPSTLIEPYVSHTSSNVKAQPTDWDLTYLRMLCVFCDNNTLSHISQDTVIVLLDGLVYKDNNQPLEFEEYN